MYALLALAAAALTSLLPIFNKQLLRESSVETVAWAVNVASLPLLALGAILLTQCALFAGPVLDCAPTPPRVDLVFVLALAGSSALNWLATILSTRSLARAEASLVSPLFSFNPAFTLLIAWAALAETPAPREAAGVAVILVGAYLLQIEEGGANVMGPLYAIIRRPGVGLAIIASACWGVTTVLEKLAIQHVRPESGPLVAFVGAALTVVLLTPSALWPRAGPAASPRWAGLRAHPRALVGAIVIASIAPLFGFTAIAIGSVGYVTALFKLSAVFTVIWARLFLGERDPRHRLLGAAVMMAGGLLITGV